VLRERNERRKLGRMREDEEGGREQEGRKRRLT
jgi:hypothetical protein